MIELADLGLRLLSMKYEPAAQYFKLLPKEPTYGVYIEKILLPLLKNEAA